MRSSKTAKTKRTRTPNKWLQNVATFAGACLACLLIAEILVRIFAPQGDYFYTSDPVLGVTHVAGMSGTWRLGDEKNPYVHMNSLGFLDDEHALAKPAGTVRIAIIGDSYTEALQVPLNESFHKLLEQQLQLDGKNVEVLSFGIGGFGTCDEYLIYEQYVKQFHPDVVVDAFLTHNDILDNQRNVSTRPTCYIAENGSVAFTKPVFDQFHELLRPLYRHSHLARLAFTAYEHLQAQPISSCEANLLPVMGAYYEPQPADYERGWNMTAAILAQFKQRTQADGSTFIVASLSNPEQTNSSLWDLARSSCPAVAAHTSNIFYPDQRLAAITRQEGIPIVQMSGIFKGQENQTDQALHLPLDHHWNAAGHALAANILTLYFEQHWPAQATP